MIIKVCGMREATNVQEVAALGIDWMGFIFYPKSPRYVLQETGHQSSITNCQLKKVGVFVNEPLESLTLKAREYKLDYLQLHGGESPEMCISLQSEGYKVIKVFSIADAEDLGQVSAYEGKADYFLFDTKCKEYGGSGKKFDWSVLDAYRGNTPFLLSGGINPESIEEILSFAHPAWVGVDLNSGFEISPAYKNIDTLQAFINRIKEIKNE
ncbi:MAG: phosphoribosylanthranilate isomerase [Tannerellaceae bacterium]|nr:phosphoribosylanthranilate isomerase [Tannerellaceae bacterium]